MQQLQQQLGLYPAVTAAGAAGAAAGGLGAATAVAQNAAAAQAAAAAAAGLPPSAAAAAAAAAAANGNNLLYGYDQLFGAAAGLGGLTAANNGLTAPQLQTALATQPGLFAGLDPRLLQAQVGRSQCFKGCC